MGAFTSSFEQGNVSTLEQTERLFAAFLSLLVIYSYLRFPLLRCNGYRLVFFLAVSDFFLNSQYFVFVFFEPYHAGNPICKTQGFIKTFFINASMFWMLLISLSLYSVIGDMDAKYQILRDFINNHGYHHLFVWVYSGICAGIPLLTHKVYGPSGGGDCGFVFSSNKSIYFSIPLEWFNIWSVILITCVVSYVLRGKLLAIIAVDDRIRETITIPNQTRSLQVQRIVDLHDQLKWYPIILLVSWATNTGIRAYQMVTNTDFSTMPLWLANTFSLTRATAWQAILNAIAYGLTPLVRNLWYEMLLEIYETKSFLLCFKCFLCCSSSCNNNTNVYYESMEALPRSFNYGRDPLQESIIQSMSGGHSSLSTSTSHHSHHHNNSHHSSHISNNSSHMSRSSGGGGGGGGGGIRSSEMELNQEGKGQASYPLNPAIASASGTSV
jgi:uncharacterized membrane protein YgcG